MLFNSTKFFYCICNYFNYLEEILYFENYDLDSVVTPVNIEKLHELLCKTGYCKEKTEELVNNFRNGFHLGYSGKTDIRRLAPNLNFRVGSEVILWNKVMKKVQAKRYAGPFKDPPFEFFIQSPIGLVPKDNGKDCRLIFHLSYPRNGESINSETLRDMC